MSHENHFDVIIIGTGAGGGTLVYHLAPSGMRILILERGDYVAREKGNWNPKAVNVDAKYNTKELWRDVDGKELHPDTNYYVGGNTKFYGAALFLLRQNDFGEIRHHGGISPALPISYDELEPYYTQAENLYQVHGNRGEDPTEPLAGEAYPWPAVSQEQRIQHLADVFRIAGLNPLHTPLGVMLDERNPRLSPQRSMKQSTCSIHGHECRQGLFARSLYVGQRIPLAGVAHENGTIRFGHHPKTSALDVNCKAHDLDNLYVVDGSFFPCSAAVNPGLTIMANALHVGDHLLQRLRAPTVEYAANGSKSTVAQPVVG